MFKPISETIKMTPPTPEAEKTKSLTAQCNGQQLTSDLLTSSDKLELLTFVKGCFDTLDTFGKTSGQLETISKMFVMVLSQYGIEDIRNAFMLYMQKSSKMPTPADIANIIEPPPEPAWKPDWAYYTQLKDRKNKGERFGRYSPEHTYFKKCEEWAQNNAKE